MLGTIATPLSLLFALIAVVFEQGWVTHGLLNLALWCIEWTMRPTQWLVAGPWAALEATQPPIWVVVSSFAGLAIAMAPRFWSGRSEEHTSELQSRGHLVCRLLLEKKKTYH